MTGRTDVDREMVAYLEARSTSRPPEGLLDAALVGVESTRQRPAWFVLDRWSPTRLSIGVERPTNAVILLATFVLLAALAIALVVVGSRPRLPPPLGLAAPGLIAFDLAGDIYASNPEGTARTQLTSGPDTDVRPIWSPDGTAIAYESRRADLTWAVIVMSADGGHRVVLADGQAQIGGIAWSPDSRRIAFGGHICCPDTGGPEYSRWHIYIAQADRPGATQIGEPDVYGLAPSWSPDGTRIAFKRVYPCCVARGDVALWIIDADGNNAGRLSSMKQLENYRVGDDVFWNTAWSPDGTRLAFLAEGIGGSLDVYVVAADGTHERNITMSPEDEDWPSWSPDGSRIAFPRMPELRPRAGFDSRSYAPEARRATFVVVDPDGLHPVRLIGVFVDSNSAIWSPDGTRLLGYVFNADLRTDDAIAIFDASGHAPPTTLPEPGFSSASWQRVAP